MPLLSFLLIHFNDMKQNMGTRIHKLDCNELSEGLQIVESPPPYTQQAIESDWRYEIIEIQPLNQNSNRYGFVIGGGIDIITGPQIIITHIDYCPTPSNDNGRTKLQLFDRILSINNISLIGVTHDYAARTFASFQGQPISLHIYRLNPRHIEHIDLILPSDISNPPLGITITGGLEYNPDDPGLFITQIDQDGLLGSTNRFHIGDRLLEIKTNYTSANLQYVTHALGIQLIRRICQDSKRVTLIISHRPIS